jgi:hypothetical protein
MATLNDPITAQNIIDRFADYVQATANSGISWGTNAIPSEIPSSYFGGDTSGKGLETAVINNAGMVVDNTVIANNVYDALLAETRRFARIRNLRAVLVVDGGGGNTGSRPSPGVVYDSTAVAHLNANYDQTLGLPDRVDIYEGNLITKNGLEQFFDNLRTEYNSARANTAYIEYHVCHASCHSSCHSSRGRR